MTQTEFNHLMRQIKALPAEQMRQLRQQIDSEPGKPRAPVARQEGQTAKGRCGEEEAAAARRV